MTRAETLDFLLENFPSEYSKTFNSVFEELSLAQPMVCVCRRLATGLHETHCQKFRSKVVAATVKRLSHLLSAHLLSAGDR